MTTCWEETVGALLDKFFPPSPEVVPQPVAEPSQHRLEITADKVEYAISRLSPNKAPGLDGLTGAMARSLWKAIPDWILALFQACVREGVFPEDWKKANLTILLKGQDRDSYDVGSYRPISLIPVLGKALERLMVDELERALEVTSRSQFGFKPGRSIEEKVVRMVRESPKTHVLGVFVDFAGAFDNLLWGPVLDKLSTIEGIDISLWRSYFSQRKVLVQEGESLVEREVTRGCPQGSICGPYVWNLMMDDLLFELEAQGIGVVAYADDLFIPIEENVVTDICVTGSRVLELVKEWGERVGVDISVGKTNCMVLKGTIAASSVRKMVPKIGDRKITSVRSTKYLGVHVSQLLRFDGHLTAVIKRLESLIPSMKRVLRREWGVTGRAWNLWLHGLLKAVALYGCTVWGEMVKTQLGRNKINAVQKRALLAGTCTFRTTAVSALQVLSGSLPWDLEVQCRMALRRVKLGLPICRLTEEDVCILTSEGVKREVFEWAIDVWQERWVNDVSGRDTYRFLPNVRMMFGMENVIVPWEANFLLTGKGEMNGFLKQTAICASVPSTGRMLITSYGSVNCMTI